MQFSDSIESNLEALREMLGGVAPAHRNRAKRAAVMIENVFTQLQKDYPRDAAVALGAAFAIYTLAERMVEQSKEAPADSRQIQLL